MQNEEYKKQKWKNNNFVVNGICISVATISISFKFN